MRRKNHSIPFGYSDTDEGIGRNNLQDMNALLRNIALCLGILVKLTGCSTGPMENAENLDCVCSLELRMITVRVENSAGEPVSGIKIESQPQFTGNTVDIPTGLHPNVPGEYVIYSDSYLGDTSSGGDTILVRGYSSGNLLFEEKFVIGLDPCGCHVEKLSGPDVITVAS